MAKKIDGVKFVKTKEYAYCNIEYFSDELKSIIRRIFQKFAMEQVRQVQEE